MKRIVTGALALFLLAGAAQAQQAPQGKEHRQHQKEQLNLTAEQKAKLKTIREEHHKAIQELKKNENITVKEWKARQQELQKKHREQVNSVLTPEQQQQLAQVHGEHRKGMKGGNRRNGQAFMQELGLTETQQAKVKDLNQNFKTKAQALRSNTALSEVQRKEQFQALAQQHRQELKAVLTPEQQQKMESLRQERRSRNGK